MRRRSGSSSRRRSAGSSIRDPADRAGSSPGATPGRPGRRPFRERAGRIGAVHGRRARPRSRRARAARRRRRPRPRGVPQGARRRRPRWTRWRPVRRAHGGCRIGRLSRLAFRFFDRHRGPRVCIPGRATRRGFRALAPRRPRLATSSDGRVLRYPTTTLTAVPINLRPDHPAFSDPRVRKALLRDRSERGSSSRCYGGARPAPTARPATRRAFDAAVTRRSL